MSTKKGGKFNKTQRGVARQFSDFNDLEKQNPMEGRVCVMPFLTMFRDGRTKATRNRKSLLQQEDLPEVFQGVLTLRRVQEKMTNR
jgi:hypothetical protein